MNILVVDDEKEITDLIQIYLENENFNVYKYYSSQDVLRDIDDLKIDLAILDVMMPDMDGFSLCNTLRRKYKFPIIFVTCICITDEDADLCLFRHLLQLCALGKDGVDQLFVIFVVKFHITVIDRDFHGNTSEIMDFRMESRGFKVQGSGFRVVVAASPQIKMGDARR